MDYDKTLLGWTGINLRIILIYIVNIAYFINILRLNRLNIQLVLETNY